MQGMETPSQAPVTAFGVSLSVIAQLPVGVLLTLRLYKLISWLPCSEFFWQALLCSGLGCVHPGLAVWVLGTFARAWEPPCAKRDFFFP